METSYTIYRPDGTQERRAVDWPEEPSYAAIRDLVQPLVGNPMEHVNVLHQGVRADMFVDEMGHMRIHPGERNEDATTIYRANWLRQHPGTDPESLPWIVGTAVVFDRIIWT